MIASHFLGNETALHLGADKFGPDTNRAAEIESGVQHNQKLNSYDLPMKLFSWETSKRGILFEVQKFPTLIPLLQALFRFAGSCLKGQCHRLFFTLLTRASVLELNLLCYS